MVKGLVKASLEINLEWAITYPDLNEKFINNFLKEYSGPDWKIKTDGTSRPMFVTYYAIME